MMSPFCALFLSSPSFKVDCLAVFVTSVIGYIRRKKLKIGYLQTWLSTHVHTHIHIHSNQSAITTIGTFTVERI